MQCCAGKPNTAWFFISKYHMTGNGGSFTNAWRQFSNERNFISSQDDKTLLIHLLHIEKSIKFIVSFHRKSSNNGLSFFHLFFFIKIQTITSLKTYKYMFMEERIICYQILTHQQWYNIVKITNIKWVE